MHGLVTFAFVHTFRDVSAHITGIGAATFVLGKLFLESGCQQEGRRKLPLVIATFTLFILRALSVVLFLNNIMVGVRSYN